MEALWHLTNHLRQTFSLEIDTAISWEYETACQPLSPHWWCCLQFGLQKGCLLLQIPVLGPFDSFVSQWFKRRVCPVIFLLDNCRLFCGLNCPMLWILILSSYINHVYFCLMLCWLNGFFCFADLFLNFWNTSWELY